VPLHRRKGLIMQHVARPRSLGILAVIGAAVIALAVSTFGVFGASAGSGNNVTICHRTRSETNPYREITVDENSIANRILGQNGHATHTGGIFPEPDWGDIIPAFNIPPNPPFPGLNVPEGQAILDNGCVPPDLPPPPPPPPGPPPPPPGPPPPPPGPPPPPPVVTAPPVFTG
jgi:hypothetical protein